MTQEHKTNSGDDATQDMPAPDHTVILDVPRELGCYRLSRLLGRGGMGEVWQALDSNLEREVAIKLMRKELIANDDANRRFFREARAVARLNHPNIVQVYAFGDEKGINYFVMELVEGETVSQRLKQFRQLPLEDALHIMLQAIEGLGYANARGIIHRDIKPSNLMLTEDSRVKIADFGLAKMVEHDTQMTAAGTAMGSPNYMSPEQARGEEADHRSDIYALGISLYQIICGDLPFTAHSPVSVLLKQIQEPLPEPDFLRTLHNGSVLSVLKKMTAKSPAARYQSYGELANALAQLQPNVKMNGAHGVTSSMPAATPPHNEFGAGDLVERSADLSPVQSVPPANSNPSSASITPAGSGTEVVSSKDIPDVYPPTYDDGDKTSNGLLWAAFASLGILVLLGMGWLLFNRDNASSSSMQSQSASADTAAVATPAATPAQATPTPAAPTPAPTTPTPAAPTPNAGSSVVVQQNTPATMQPVDIAVVITPAPTLPPGVPATVTPTPNLRDLMPQSVKTPPPSAPAPPVYLLGIPGDPSSSPIPTYTDAAGRNQYKQYPAGTEAVLVQTLPTMLRVLPAGESRHVYIHKKMAQLKP